MDTTKDSAPAHPPTREARGLKLYRERADEIERIYPHTYSVPSCTGATSYVVRLDRGTCECADQARHPELNCKHLFAATIKAAKIRARRRFA